VGNFLRQASTLSTQETDSVIVPLWSGDLILKVADVSSYPTLGRSGSYQGMSGSNPATAGVTGIRAVTSIGWYGTLNSVVAK
jgi:hypothetical protein